MQNKTDIELVFHNKGLRSYIEVDLCSCCPRQDDKGCCGFYSPVFYPTDFAFLMLNQPSLIDFIFSLDDITILDYSVTINSVKDGDSYLCKFHTKENGCLIPQNLRESICRHFVCPGINWENEELLKEWKDFFEKLSSYEIELNNRIWEIAKSKGLSLRNANSRKVFFDEVLKAYLNELQNPPSFFNTYPDTYKVTIKRVLQFGKEWPL